MSYIDKSLTMLEGWVEYSKSDLYVCPDRPDLICYGAGYDGWGIQTHQKALAAYAVVATEKSSAELLDVSVRMLRFMLESHIEGSYRCLDSAKWGHTWISALGTERAMHGIDRLTEYLTAADKELLRKVLISEADWFLDNYPIHANPHGSSGKNCPESNIWNGAFLRRVAMMYPDAPRRGEYESKGTRFLINGISIPSDAAESEVYDGKPVSEWFIGNQFFESYSLDHHSYLNIGYMVICLSNIAMLHFACKRHACEPPKALYRHADELWRLIKACMFGDGRLIRIGGDTRVRYCYCQDYVLPMLLFVRDYYGDKDCEQLESAMVALFQKEYAYNNDGSFLSKRLDRLKTLSPIYYTRLESDKVCALSMLIDWDKNTAKGGSQITPTTTWREEYHGACLERGERRFASFCWKSANGAMGLCLPVNIGNLAEWDNNLVGDIRGMAHNDGEIEVVTHTEEVFSGGFLTYGTFHRLTSGFVAENQKPEITAVQKLVFVALPDDATVVTMQYAYTVNRTYIKSVKGIKLNVPNDVYNDFKRTYYSDGSWLNVDNMLGVIRSYGTDALRVHQPKERQIGIKNEVYYNDTPMFRSDEICTKLQLSPRWADKGEVLLDEGAVIVAGATADETVALAGIASNITIQADDMIRYVIVTGIDGKRYIVIANFGNTEQDIVINAEKLTIKADEARWMIL